MKHIITTLLLFGLTFSVEAQVYLGEMDTIIGIKSYLVLVPQKIIKIFLKSYLPKN